jgi:hypothetical protein
MRNVSQSVAGPMRDTSRAGLAERRESALLCIRTSERGVDGSRGGPSGLLEPRRARRLWNACDCTWHLPRRLPIPCPPSWCTLESRHRRRRERVAGSPHRILQANRTGPAELLIDDPWGEGSPETARNTLQTYVYRLRKLLGDGRIEGRSGGYVLSAAPEEIDAARLVESSMKNKT